MRQRVEEGFRAPVYSTYGSHEFFLMAVDCPATGGYHVCEDTMILEVVRDGKRVAPGEEGEVVGTALHSYAMPFIRYRLEDIVLQGETPCRCGAPFASVKRILGRQIEYFTLPSGRLLHPYAIVGGLLNAAPWVQRYQMIQEQIDQIHVKLVGFRSASPEEIQRVIRAVSEAMGPDMRVSAEVVERIPLHPSGKLKPYFSLVSNAA
jgi:phenylacetate-CoA ligase